LRSQNYIYSTSAPQKRGHKEEEMKSFFSKRESKRVYGGKEIKHVENKITIDV
jgi:hypothetical protein